MNNALCPHCGTDDVEYIHTDDDGIDEYFCCECQRHFIIDWEVEEENTNSYPNEYFEDMESEENDNEDYEEEY